MIPSDSKSSKISVNLKNQRARNFYILKISILLFLILFCVTHEERILIQENIFNINLGKLKPVHKRKYLESVLQSERNQFGMSSNKKYVEKLMKSAGKKLNSKSKQEKVESVLRSPDFKKEKELMSRNEYLLLERQKKLRGSIEKGNYFDRFTGVKARAFEKANNLGDTDFAFGFDMRKRRKGRNNLKHRQNKFDWSQEIKSHKRHMKKRNKRPNFKRISKYRNQKRYRFKQRQEKSYKNPSILKYCMRIVDQRKRRHRRKRNVRLGESREDTVYEKYENQYRENQEIRNWNREDRDVTNYKNYSMMFPEAKMSQKNGAEYYYIKPNYETINNSSDRSSSKRNTSDQKIRRNNTIINTQNNRRRNRSKITKAVTQNSQMRSFTPEKMISKSTIKNPRPFTNTKNTKKRSQTISRSRRKKQRKINNNDQNMKAVPSIQKAGLNRSIPRSQKMRNKEPQQISIPEQRNNIVASRSFNARKIRPQRGNAQQTNRAQTQSSKSPVRRSSAVRSNQNRRQTNQNRQRRSVRRNTVRRNQSGMGNDDDFIESFMNQMFSSKIQHHKIIFILFILL